MKLPHYSQRSVMKKTAERLNIYAVVQMTHLNFGVSNSLGSDTDKTRLSAGVGNHTR